MVVSIALDLRSLWQKVLGEGKNALDLEALIKVANKSTGLVEAALQKVSEGLSDGDPKALPLLEDAGLLSELETLINTSPMWSVAADLKSCPDNTDAGEAHSKLTAAVARVETLLEGRGGPSLRMMCDWVKTLWSDENGDSLLAEAIEAKLSLTLKTSCASVLGLPESCHSVVGMVAGGFPRHFPRHRPLGAGLTAFFAGLFREGACVHESLGGVEGPG